MDLNRLSELATRYAKAWSSQHPESVATFFAEDGSLSVNDSAPAVGRRAIAEVARGFMSAFPDMTVSMDDVVSASNGTAFHWTLTGTNSGPGGTGKRVRISGRELWQFDSQGLIRQSTGSFDSAEYDRQFEFGVDGLSPLIAQSLAAHYGRVRGKIHASRGAALDRATLAASLSVRQLGRASSAASDRQSQLLHRHADRGNGIRSRPAARVRRYVSAIQRRGHTGFRSCRGHGARDARRAARGRLGCAVSSALAPRTSPSGSACSCAAPRTRIIMRDR